MSLHHADRIIREGRAALAPCSRALPAGSVHRSLPVARLLAMLWHTDPGVRRAAALALAGGDRETAHAPAYGHFPGILLRLLAREEIPECPRARYEAVSNALRTLLTQNTVEIRAMSNMHYSFLSSALYLALLSTCRDGIEAVRRLRLSAAHVELCDLLWNLTLASRTRRLNRTDVDALVQMVGRALAALPASEIPGFWAELRHRVPARRRAVLPAVAHFTDRGAVPYLIDVLPDQPPDITEPIIHCLGRLGDPRALSALAPMLSHRNRQIRKQAQSAITAIERAIGSQSRTLLRPAIGADRVESGQLLRSLPVESPTDPPDQLLRVHGATDLEV
ncbi:MAG: HEAT repeat domain-containing protein [Chthonomonadaceae bacterium]|nr:HEAT repeat domain-containing protein [Chthonomonadaceae bacterium]